MTLGVVIYDDNAEPEPGFCGAAGQAQTCMPGQRRGRRVHPFTRFSTICCGFCDAGSSPGPGMDQTDADSDRLSHWPHQYGGNALNT